MKNFGERLRNSRENAGFSQDELAEKIGLKSGKQTISRWERDLSEPSVSQLVAMAEVLTTTVAFLLGEQTHKEGVPTNKMLVDKDEYIDLLRRDINRKQAEIDRLKPPGDVNYTSTFIVRPF